MAKGLIGEADFYRARAIDMMKKAQSAPSAAIRQIYLELARKWAEQADSLQNAAPPGESGTDQPPCWGGAAAGETSSEN